MNADAIVICFSTSKPASLQNVTEKWIKEINNYYKDTNNSNNNNSHTPPILLVATKTDVRAEMEEKETAGNRVTTTQQGETVGTEIGAKAFFECSAKTGEGVAEIMAGIVQAKGGKGNGEEFLRELGGVIKAGSGCCGKERQTSSVDEDEINCVLVGDGSVGKNRLLISYTTNSFDGAYILEEFKAFQKDVDVDGKKVDISLYQY